MPKRRGRGEGTKQRLPSGSYRTQIVINGRRISLTAKTWAEVTRLRRDLLDQVDRGLDVNTLATPFGAYLQSWLESSSASLRPSTLTHYHSLAAKYVLPLPMAGIPLKDLKPDHLQRLYNDLAAQGAGAATRSKLHALLHVCLNQAMRAGLIARNPADVVISPRLEQPEMSVYDEAQVSRLLAAAQGSRIEALIRLALSTGMRQMELLGLLWSDLDAPNQLLHIRRQLSRQPPVNFIPLKTRNARRDIPLGARTLQALAAHAQRQNLERSFAGSRWVDTGLIFTNTLGGPFHFRNLVERYYYPLLESAGLPPIRFHDLRHTAASLMLGPLNIPLMVVSRILGHSRPSITLNVYGHLIPSSHTESARLMDELLSPSELLNLDLP
jgi:integrase